MTNAGRSVTSPVIKLVMRLVGVRCLKATIEFISFISFDSFLVNFDGRKLDCAGIFQ